MLSDLVAFWLTFRLVVLVDLLCGFVLLNAWCFDLSFDVVRFGCFSFACFLDFGVLVVFLCFGWLVGFVCAFGGFGCGFGICGWFGRLATVFAFLWVVVLWFRLGFGWVWLFVL